MYICLGIDRRLPKSIFLPQLLLVFWSIFDLWPLPVIYDSSGYRLMAAAIQVLLGILPMANLKQKHGGSWLLPVDMFSAPYFKLKHTVLFCIANMLILPVVLVYLALSIASLQLYKQTGGFARMWPDGLRMMERVYRNADKEIRLTSMIHIADKAYFDDVLESISTERTIVLAEGVSDQDNLLAYNFSYGGLARDLGLASQEKMVFSGKMIEVEDIQTAASTIEDDNYHILRADIDVNEFHPKTLEFLNIIGKHVLSGNSVSEGLRNYLTWVKENSKKVKPETIMKDILHRRNREVIHHLDRVLDQYDTIIVPWGALHMPEIETAVLDRGFHLSDSRLRTSIDFKRMISDRF